LAAKTAEVRMARITPAAQASGKRYEELSLKR
jgi:hypothetical protein